MGKEEQIPVLVCRIHEAVAQVPSDLNGLPTRTAGHSSRLLEQAFLS